MNEQELWEQKYKEYKELNKRYYGIFKKYFPPGLVRPRKLISDKEREELKEISKARKVVSKALYRIEQGILT